MAHPGPHRPRHHRARTRSARPYRYWQRHRDLPTARVYLRRLRARLLSAVIASAAILLIAMLW